MLKKSSGNNFGRYKTTKQSLIVQQRRFWLLQPSTRKSMNIKPFPMKSLSSEVVTYYRDQGHITDPFRISAWTGPGQYTVT